MTWKTRLNSQVVDLDDIRDIPRKASPISLTEAYDQLSPLGFGLWVRIAAIPPSDLIQGRTHTFRVLEIPETWRRQYDYYLSELRDKGYIEAIPVAGKATKLTLLLAPLLTAPNHYINLG